MDPLAAAAIKERKRLMIKINLNGICDRKNEPLPIKPLLLQEELTKECEAFRKQEEEEESKEQLRQKYSKERLLQKYRDEQSKKKAGRIKIISLQDLPPMPKKMRQHHRAPVPNKKPEEAPRPMGMTSVKHAVPMKKRGEKIKNFLNKSLFLFDV